MILSTERNNTIMTEQNPYEIFREHLPMDHECLGEDCPYPEGMHMLVIKDPAHPDEDNAYISNFFVHGIDPGRLVSACIDFVDNAFQQNKPDDVPAMIAFTRGRDLIRAALEQLPPPPNVAAEVASFTDEHLSAWKGILGE